MRLDVDFFFFHNQDPDGKPVWDDDIEIDDILPDPAPVQEEINFEPGGDAYDPLAPGGKKLSKKMKRLAKAEKKRGVPQNMESEKEEEDPVHTEEVDDLEGLSPEERKKKLLEALDEYHKLDCEDMVCRNRYSILTLRLMTDTIDLYECSK
jgi:protein KRI1